MLCISVPLAAFLALLPAAMGQAPIWGQCGGQGFTGPTTCATGSVCYFDNPFFSTCFPTATSTAGANDIARSRGGKLYFGTAADNFQLNDAAYAAKLDNISIFGQITPASLSWAATEPVQGFFTFEAGDAMVARARKNGQLVRSASCISVNDLPSWVNTVNVPGSALQNIIVNHCFTLVGALPLCHYSKLSDVRLPDRLYSSNTTLVYVRFHHIHFGALKSVPTTDAWDVVNEPFTDDGFMNPVGTSTGAGLSEDYVAALLSAGRAADPDAKLYITSSDMDTGGPKFTSMLDEVQYWLDHDTPIDGIGFRSHFAVGSLPSREALSANYEAFTALGVEVAITALDIRMGSTQSGADILQQQADYQTVISACKAVAGCVGVTLADITDKYSTAPADFPGSGNALPWDYNIIPKRAYDGIIAGFTN
ncbi:beta-1,4-endoxylanase [Mycena galopus ATCC 62051]|nr:beta-1,4-endoxylanase [Mycena galopus ATCC 62051]